MAATTRTDALASYSHYGLVKVHLGAPGGEVPSNGDQNHSDWTNGIYSTWYLSTAPYAYDAGTSMAAPHVAGIFALLEATDPEDHYVQLINRLLSSTDPITSLSGICQTGGRADLRNALATTYWWPRNDNFAKAFTIANPSSANSITFVGNNVDATKQNGRTQSCWERRG